MLPQLLFYYITHEIKKSTVNQVIYCQIASQISPNFFYMRLEETDIKFSSLGVGKKGLFILDIVCGALNDQLSVAHISALRI